MKSFKFIFVTLFFVSLSARAEMMGMQPSLLGGISTGGMMMGGVSGFAAPSQLPAQPRCSSCGLRPSSSVTINNYIRVTPIIGTHGTYPTLPPGYIYGYPGYGGGYGYGYGYGAGYGYGGYYGYGYGTCGRCHQTIVVKGKNRRCGCQRRRGGGFAFSIQTPTFGFGFGTRTF